MAAAGDLDAFTLRYADERPWSFEGRQHIDRSINWAGVAKDYQGVIIAPFVWDRRLHDAYSWYYTWDCASGCIWDAAAIERVEPLFTAAALGLGIDFAQSGVYPPCDAVK
jgi:hypothetical protein